MRTYRRTPSPWLAPIEATVSAARAPEGGNGARDEQGRGLAAAREQVAGARRQSGATRDQLDADGNRAPRRAPRMASQPRRASGVPAYVIFHDTTLEAVARDRPRSRGDLLTIPGIGPVKLQRHGQALLEMVGQHPG